VIEKLAGTSFYFAYGSNMCTRNLQKTSPSAVPLGVARLPGHELQFRKSSGRPEEGGSSMPFPTGKDASVVWGVLYRMADKDLESLVRLEDGYYGYDPTPLAVFPRGSDQKVMAIVFRARPQDIDQTIRPFDWYLRWCLEGAWLNDLPADYIAKFIMAQEWVRDPNDKQRAECMAVTC
jgi:hypothetical protein